jgi:hypothetical protein
MNVKPINFTGIFKILGNNPKEAARKIAQSNEEGAHYCSFDNNKTAYVVTGDEYKKVQAYYIDMAKRIDGTAQEHNHSKYAVEVATEIEYGRYLDLSKMLIIDREDCTINTIYDELDDEIIALDVIG